MIIVFINLDKRFIINISACFFINDKKRKRNKDKELKNSDGEDYLGHGGIDDLNLQASEGEESDEEIETVAQKRNKGHKLTVTSVVIAKIRKRGVQTGKLNIYIYSASKVDSIIKWDFWTRKRLHVFEGGLKPTNKLKKYLGSIKLKENVGQPDIASGGKDKLINIWSVIEDKHLKSFVRRHDYTRSENNTG
ncbi:hypothetical protein H8356DRAFT_1072140 [Neocallimastix lanati (nom. inval.)]|uniref:Uncharacterized protein n=1 Tax=Neocallimastix californiae TaxID=1754190 RepID=A0A1Y2FTA0_9FUNG|nr:hypothetical protein H8356DRAFT_1072140 [Neocallimastix sp. JGI-2020a]ORY87198.1 hypothetical protein LY90DRAFT_498452 [Neocallimastix californiae]|eukprot:ORY87198.1 hypothetical protein LY90DRAFT_498452 [Neocallimastix californiae]